MDSQERGEGGDVMRHDLGKQVPSSRRAEQRFLVYRNDKTANAGTRRTRQAVMTG